MTPQQLTISSAENGDCLRACVASLLDLPIEEVPNFMDFGGDDGGWFSDPENGMNAFLWRNGYEYTGSESAESALKNCPGVDGHYIGVVDSVNFPGSTHAVIFKGLELVHDPSTLTKWTGTGKEARDYYLIQKREADHGTGDDL